MTLEQRLSQAATDFAREIVALIDRQKAPAQNGRRRAKAANGRKTAKATNGRKARAGKRPPGRRPCIAPGCKNMGTPRNHWLCADHKNAPAAQWRKWQAARK